MKILQRLKEWLYEYDATYEEKKRRFQEQRDRDNLFREDQRKRTILVKVEHKDCDNGGMGNCGG